MRSFAAALMALLPAVAIASESFLAGLERRLQADGPDGVNTYLGTQAAGMAELNRLTADCAPQAINISVRLSRGNDPKANDVHREALRIAVGACTDYVLSQVSVSEVPKVCASAASWTVSQTARELRRRIANIEADEVLRSSPRGKACAAAYRFELHNTRVGVRLGQPGARPR
ncbi:MAG TPA: hypothetical protein VFL64_19100 [Rhizobacter sp.]|nr:hypothetical protein [Rhizobacter sp.]